ncbi:MAG: ribonuclease HI [Candidatus Paceibacteria bacterium]|jgi:ribonuclease HI
MQKIFTDGSSRGNPGPGGWGTIVLSGNKVIEYGGRNKSTTNNRMELNAVIEGLSNVMQDIPVSVYTDSSYVAKGSQFWIKGWKNNSWMTQQKTEVLNKDLWEKMDKVLEGKKITWNVIKGHAGVPGNERCDKIATSFADDVDIELFNGNSSDYKVDLDNVKADSMQVKDNSRKGVKPYSYLSLVGKELRRHKTWSECEDCVKGKSDVKFRKAISKEDEEEIIKSWGFQKPE